jgi:hypothetical protein
VAHEIRCICRMHSSPGVPIALPLHQSKIVRSRMKITEPLPLLKQRKRDRFPKHRLLI